MRSGAQCDRSELSLTTKAAFISKRIWKRVHFSSRPCARFATSIDAQIEIRSLKCVILKQIVIFSEPPYSLKVALDYGGAGHVDHRTDGHRNTSLAVERAIRPRCCGRPRASVLILRGLVDRSIRSEEARALSRKRRQIRACRTTRSRSVYQSHRRSTRGNVHERIHRRRIAGEHRSTCPWARRSDARIDRRRHDRSRARSWPRPNDEFHRAPR